MAYAWWIKKFRPYTYISGLEIIICLLYLISLLEASNTLHLNFISLHSMILNPHRLFWKLIQNSTGKSRNFLCLLNANMKPLSIKNTISNENEINIKWKKQCSYATYLQNYANINRTTKTINLATKIHCRIKACPLLLWSKRQAQNWDTNLT